MVNPLNFLNSLAKAGLLVGCFDAMAASIYSYALAGSTPDRVFCYVASGVFGQDAFAGGLPIAAMGLLFHFIVAMGWTALFFVVLPKISFFSSNKFAAGAVYGIFIWIMMNFVVVPLSNVPPGPFHFTWKTLIMIGIHMFVIGVPISYFANNYYSRSENGTSR